MPGGYLVREGPKGPERKYFDQSEMLLRQDEGWSFDPEEEYTFTEKDGTVISVDAKNAPYYLEQGMALESTTSKAYRGLNEEDQEKHVKGALNRTLAAGEGLAGGAVPFADIGLATEKGREFLNPNLARIAKQKGLSGELRKGLALRKNTTLGTVSEVVGLVGSTIASGGTNLPLRAAGKAAAKKATGDILEKSLLRKVLSGGAQGLTTTGLAKGTTALGGKIAGKNPGLARRALGEAVAEGTFGAALGAAQGASNLALQDGPHTSEMVFSEIAGNAGFGALLGAGFGGGGSLLRSGKDAGARAIAKRSNTLLNPNSKVTKELRESILESFGNVDSAGFKAADIEQKMGVRAAKDTRKATVARLKKQGVRSPESHGFIPESKTALSSLATSQAATARAIGAVIKDGRMMVTEDVVTKLLAQSPAKFNSAMKSLSGYDEAVEAAFTKSGKDYQSFAPRLTKRLDKVVESTGISQAELLAMAETAGVIDIESYSPIASKLVQAYGLMRAGATLSGGRQKTSAFANQLKDSIALRTASAKAGTSISRGSKPIVETVTSAAKFTAAKHLMKTGLDFASGAGNVAGMVGNATNKIASGVKKFVSAAGKVGKVARTPVATILKTHTFSDRPHKDPRPHGPVEMDSVQNLFKKRATEITKLSVNLGSTERKLKHNLRYLYALNPKLAEEVKNTALRGIAHLGLQVPRQSQLALGIKSDRTKIPEYQISRFAKRMAVVSNPISTIMDALNSGRLTKEMTETLKEVHPNIYQKIQIDLMTAVAEAPGDLPYKKRISLSNLFEVPVDRSYKHDFAMFMQQLHIPKELGGASPAPRRASSIVKSEPLTPGQKTATGTD